MRRRCDPAGQVDSVAFQRIMLAELERHVEYKVRTQASTHARAPAPARTHTHNHQARVATDMLYNQYAAVHRTEVNNAMAGRGRGGAERAGCP